MYVYFHLNIRNKIPVEKVNKTTFLCLAYYVLFADLFLYKLKMSLSFGWAKKMKEYRQIEKLTHRHYQIDRWID